LASKGTIRVRPEDAAGIPDEDFRELVVPPWTLTIEEQRSAPLVESSSVQGCGDARRLEVLGCGVEQPGIGLSQEWSSAKAREDRASFFQPRLCVGVIEAEPAPSCAE
jgi:hypothetical protein